MKVAILFFLGVIARQAYGDEPEAVVGGNIATKGQFPYQVSIQAYGEHFCGGTIISNTLILSAAHCFEDGISASRMKVVTGTHDLRTGGQSHRVKCCRMHPEYTGMPEDGYEHDIAVLILRDPIDINKLQAPIPLATKDYTLGPSVPRALLSGFGKTSTVSRSSPVLKWADLYVLKKEQCLNSHGLLPIKKMPINPKQICTLENAGTGSCHGDSGGPLVMNGELCGVVSFSLAGPCAVGVPDVYTNVYYYKKFIKDSETMCY